MAPFLVKAKHKAVYVINESFLDDANDILEFGLLKEIPLTLMRDRDDTVHLAGWWGMRRGVLYKDSVPEMIFIKTPRLIPPLCLPVCIVIPNAMILRWRRIIAMRDLPVVRKKAK